MGVYSKARGAQSSAHSEPTLAFHIPYPGDAPVLDWTTNVSSSVRSNG